MDVSLIQDLFRVKVHLGVQPKLAWNLCAAQMHGENQSNVRVFNDVDALQLNFIRIEDGSFQVGADGEW